MVQRRSSTQPAEDIGNETIEAAAITVAAAPAASVGWAGDDDAQLGELLGSHGFAAKLTARLIELANAPTHVKRPVDRLAIALGAQFNFFALEEARQQPILLCGLPGAGTSTLATKLAARYDDSEVLVISAGAHAAEKTALLAENSSKRSICPSPTRPMPPRSAAPSARPRAAKSSSMSPPGRLSIARR